MATSPRKPVSEMTLDEMGDELGEYSEMVPRLDEGLGVLAERLAEIGDAVRHSLALRQPRRPDRSHMTCDRKAPHLAHRYDEDVVNGTLTSWSECIGVPSAEGATDPLLQEALARALVQQRPEVFATMADATSTAAAAIRAIGMPGADAAS